MTLPELSIRRHVLAFMFSAVIVLFGLIAYLRIGIDRFPDVELPMLTVTTALPGASPEVIDQSITNVLESSLNGVPGINHIASSSSPGASVILIMFEVEKDIDVAFNEVQAKLGQVARLLPQEAYTPVVAKADIGATPIMWLALQGDRTQQDLNRYANNIIKKQLENISGVGEVLLGGKRDRNIRVELDLTLLNASGLTAQDLLRAFANEHIQMPGGFLVDGQRENLINLDLEFHSVEALGGMVVGYRNGHALRLRDITTLKNDLADYRQLARFDGQPSVGIGIIKISDANAVAIVERVQEVMEKKIIPQLPAGMHLTV